MKKSKLVTFIGAFYIFGGIIIFLSLFFKSSQLNLVFNLEGTPDYIVKILVSAIYIPLGYLYLNRIKNSNKIIAMLAVIFACISADLVEKYNTQPYIGNLIYSIIVIIVSIAKKAEFTNDFKVLFKKSDNLNL